MSRNENCDENVYIGLELKKMNSLFKRVMFARLAKEGLDEIAIMHGYVIGYLYRNRDRDVFQRDIETHFMITKSNVTAIIKNLESKGYVIRTSVESDARLKKLTLTEEGIKVQKKTICIIDRIHKESEEGITSEEKEQMLRLINKINNNLREMEE